MEKHFCDMCGEEMDNGAKYKMEVKLESNLGGEIGGHIQYGPSQEFEFENLTCLLGFFESPEFTNRFTGTKNLFTKESKSGFQIVDRHMIIRIDQVKDE